MVITTYMYEALAMLGMQGVFIHGTVHQGLLLQVAWAFWAFWAFQPMSVPFVLHLCCPAKLDAHLPTMASC